MFQQGLLAASSDARDARGSSHDPLQSFIRQVYVLSRKLEKVFVRLKGFANRVGLV